MVGQKLRSSTFWRDSLVGGSQPNQGPTNLQGRLEPIAMWQIGSTFEVKKDLQQTATAEDPHAVCFLFLVSFKEATMQTYDMFAVP